MTIELQRTGGAWQLCLTTALAQACAFFPGGTFSTPSAWLRKNWKWIALVVGVIGLSVAVYFLPVGNWVKTFTHWVRGLGLAGAFIFIGVYAIAALFFSRARSSPSPPDWSMGSSDGTAVALVRGNLRRGASLFWPAATSFASGSKNWPATTKGSARSTTRLAPEGWKIVGLLRLQSAHSLQRQQLFLGVTAIGFWPYFLASFVGMLPGTLLYAYLGAIGQAGLAGAKRVTARSNGLFSASGFSRPLRSPYSLAGSRKRPSRKAVLPKRSKAAR